MTEIFQKLTIIHCMLSKISIKDKKGEAHERCSFQKNKTKYSARH